MNAERQTKIDYGEMLEKLTPKHRRLDDGGQEVVQAAPCEEERASSACTQPPALASETLMERICEPENLKLACKRVMGNQGAAGVDGMAVRQLPGWLGGHKQELIAALLDGNYQPTEVRGVCIPKPGGGVRQLGIPTVVGQPSTGPKNSQPLPRDPHEPVQLGHAATRHPDAQGQESGRRG